MNKDFNKDFLAEFSNGHRIITWVSFQCQPEWVRQIWMTDAYKMAEEYSLYGDTYYSNQEELGSYVELSDGMAPVCSPGVLRYKHHYGHMKDYWESPFFEQTEKVIFEYSTRIIDALKRGDYNFAARVAGAAAHYFEDCGVPAHAVDNCDLATIQDYIDCPSGFETFPLHAYTELSPPGFLINEYKPKCYGESSNIFANSFIIRFVELVLHARKLLYPLIQAAIANDTSTADRLRLSAAKMCARVFADFLYTVSCIGSGQVDKMEDNNHLSLTACWPYRMSAWAPFPYFETTPTALNGINLAVKTNNLIEPCPCKLRIEENGHVKHRQFDDALGAGTYFEYHFRLSANTYHRFTSIIGIHAELGATCPIEFQVVADDKMVFSKTIKSSDLAVTVDVDINGCHDLKLITCIKNYTEKTGRNNHATWAEPRVLVEKN